MMLHFPPARFVFSTLTLFTFICYLVILQITHQPWLGVRFSAATEGLTVTFVAQQGAAAGKLKRGQIINTIEGKQDTALLTAKLLQAPDVWSTFQAFNDYLTAHQQVSTILREPVVTFVLDNEARISIRPSSHHPILAIGWINLFYLLSAFLCMGVSLLVWHYCRQLFVTRLILIAGTGIFLYYLSVVLQYRELALTASWLHLTAVISSIGTNLFAWGFLSVFMVYPLRIFSNKSVLFFLLLLLVITLNNVLQWLELPFHAYMFHFLLVATWFYYLLFLQWQLTQQHPLEKAVIKLFILILVIPTMLVVLMWLIPIVLGKSTQLSHEFARFVFIPITIGWSFTVFRYRLFNVELWWLKSSLWMAGGVLVLLFDVIFVYITRLEPLSALSIALISAGFLYFPIRQWLLTRFFSESQSLLSHALPRFIQSLQTAATDADFQKVWQQVLKEHFQPIETSYLVRHQERTCFADEGLKLLVPDIVDNACYKFSGKHKGNKLFNKSDVEATESLSSLARAILHASRAREEAVLEERTRIMRDLHDSLGAKLLAMVQRCQGHHSADDAREALQTLRDTVHFSIATEPLVLNALLGEWRMETYERLEVAGVKLHWQTNDIPDTLKLSPTHMLVLLAFLRETLSNALKHAHPKHIYILVSLEKISDQLSLSVSNDGEITPPESWKLGFGLSHLRERLLHVGGELRIRQIQSVDGVSLIETKACLQSLQFYIKK